jgi:transcriptional regulator with XRE-family HTH domain
MCKIQVTSVFLRELCMEEYKSEQLKQFGQKLHDLRKNAGLSLAEVGKAVDLSHNYLSEIERGKKEPSRETIRDLAEFYNIDEDELFEILTFRVPTRTIEFVKHDKDFQKLLSKLQKKHGNNPEKIDIITERVRKLFDDFLRDDE